MSAAHDQTDGGKDRRAVGDSAGVKVRVEVVDQNERLFQDECERFCGGEADEQGTDESRGMGDGDGGQVVESNAGVGDDLVDDWQDSLDVGAAATSGTTPR